MMAEGKYNLLVVPTGTDNKIYNQPWYKERLRTRYIKSLKQGDTSRFLTGRNWTFLKDGLDDFRDGLPPPADDDVIIQGSKGLSPNIHGSATDISAVKQPVTTHRFTKEEICFSRVTPLQQQRRDHIEEVEYGLTQHPLALYPHLEECLPLDVFEDVVNVLDPEMDMDPYDQEDEEEETVSERTELPPVHLTKITEEKEEGQMQDDGKVRNPYRWLPKKEEKDRRDRKKAAERKNQSPSQDEHIKSVTTDFCSWVSSLGGETNNIEESTITSLFASGYETKPALSVPIHVVELTNVPPELRQSAAVATPQEQPKPVQIESKKTEWTHSGSYEPSWVKFKYGAWYLDPATWHARAADEPLEDPKEIKEKETSESKEKSLEMDKQLAPMHGAKAFMDFISKKNTRQPDFLGRVSDIQEEQAREEQARIEAELAKQRRRTSRKQSSAAS